MPNTAIDTLLSSITDALRCEGEFSELSNRSCSDQLDAISALVDAFKLKQNHSTSRQDVFPKTSRFEMLDLLLTEASDRGYTPYMVSYGRNSASVRDGYDVVKKLHLGQFDRIFFQKGGVSSALDFWVSINKNHEECFIQDFEPGMDAEIIVRVVAEADWMRRSASA